MEETLKARKAQQQARLDAVKAAQEKKEAEAKAREEEHQARLKVRAARRARTRRGRLMSCWLYGYGRTVRPL